MLLHALRLFANISACVIFVAVLAWYVLSDATGLHYKEMQYSRAAPESFKCTAVLFAVWLKCQ